MIEKTRSTAVVIFLSAMLTGCASISDCHCGKDKAMAELSNLGMLALYFTENELTLSEQERKGLFVMASSMATSAAVEGVPEVNEMRGIHENGILWLMDHEGELEETISPSTASFLQGAYSDVVIEINEAREKATSKMRGQN